MRALPQCRNMPFLLLVIFAVPDASAQLSKKLGKAAERGNENPPMVKNKTEEPNL